MYKIKELLKRNNFDRVEIGTTETFQGREKRIIIISTVRARQDLLLYDKKYNLGFVRNDKVILNDVLFYLCMYSIFFRDLTLL